MMRRAGRYLTFTLLLVAAVCLVCSCIRDRHDDGLPPAAADDATRQLFVIEIKPIENGSSSYGVLEKIESLRVIAIGDNGIEINRMERFDVPVEASKFEYTFTWPTTYGTKDFYIIANEESAVGSDGKIKYLASNDLPAGLPETLAELLDYERYKATMKGESLDEYDDLTDETKAANRAVAEEFKAVIKAVYFDPTYNPTTVEGTDVKEIFLPYTTFYDNVTFAKPEKSETKATRTEPESGEAAAGNRVTMYLVPVATKFIFQFINDREADIELQNIKIGGTVVDKEGTTGGVDFEKDDKDKKVMVGGLNRSNFLMAAVGQNDIKKTFADDGKEYRWVDWLAKVSELSHGHVSSGDVNADFNKKYGWISDYSMPVVAQSDFATWTIVDMKTDAGKYPTVKGTKDNNLTEEARSIVMGPYYMPESRYEVTYEQEFTENGKKVTKKITEQRYTLNLYLHDTDSASTAGALDLEFAEPVGNIGALFRNTYVIIVVRMGGKVDLNVYAQVEAWNRQSVYGTATEQP